MKSINLNKEREGEIIILVGALIWSFFPIITKLTYSNIHPFLSLSISTFFATIFFAVIISFRGKWQDLKNKSARFDILMATFIVGILFYGLIFWGISLTKAGNAAIIMLMEIFFSYLFFNVWKKESFRKEYLIGIILMAIGALIVLFPKDFAFRTGDIIILFATMIPPLGNYFQRRARKKVCTECLLFVRSFITAIFMILISLSFFQLPSINDIQSSLIFLVINGIFIFGLAKIAWVEAIHRISVTKCLALNSISPFFTLIFAYYILTELPTLWQIVGLIPMIIGIYFLTFKKSFSFSRKNSTQQVF